MLDLISSLEKTRSVQIKTNREYICVETHIEKVFAGLDGKHGSVPMVTICPCFLVHFPCVCLAAVRSTPYFSNIIMTPCCKSV